MKLQGFVGNIPNICLKQSVQNVHLNLVDKFTPTLLIQIEKLIKLNQKNEKKYFLTKYSHALQGNSDIIFI